MVKDGEAVIELAEGVVDEESFECHENPPDLFKLRQFACLALDGSFIAFEGEALQAECAHVSEVFAHIGESTPNLQSQHCLILVWLIEEVPLPGEAPQLAPDSS